MQQILGLQEPLTGGPLHDVHLTGVHTIAIGCLVAQGIRGVQRHQSSSSKNPSQEGSCMMHASQEHTPLPVDVRD